MNNPIDKLPGFDRLPGLPDELKKAGKAELSRLAGDLKSLDETGIRGLTDGLKPVEPVERPFGTEAPVHPTFGNILGNLISDVDHLHKTAEKANEKMIAGELEDIHQVVVAMEEAQISFRLLMEVRNKLVEAYKEVMKTQV